MTYLFFLIQESSKRSLHMLSSAIYETVNRFVDTVTQEAASKFTVIRVHAAEELKPFAQQLEFETARLGREISRVRRQVKMMYRTNSYYVRDISKACDVAFDRVM